MPISIRPLTPDLVAKLKAEAALALNGDGSCSLRAMTTSCFASENCANGYSALHLDVLLTQAHAFVAVDVTPDGREHFVGCVSAAPVTPECLAQRLFPAQDFTPGSMVLSNLCVAEDYRNGGVRGQKHIGRALVHAILALRSPATYLLIARGGSRNDSETDEAFAKRVPRLKETYRKLRFVPCKRCPRAILMRHHL